ncbi:MAG: hypothetical protein WCG92_09580, partial [Hyphomicrobiales bacterium]
PPPAPTLDDGITGRPKNCTGPPQALLSDPTQLIDFSAVSVFDHTSIHYGHGILSKDRPANEPLFDAAQLTDLSVVSAL